MAYISAKEYAAKHKRNYRYIRILAVTGRIPGARKNKIGGAWMIPENAVIVESKKK